MGVLIIEVWAVAPKVFISCLLHLMGVWTKCFLVASCQCLVQGYYLSLLQMRGPLGVPLDMVPLGGETSTGSGEGCHHLGLGECSGRGKEGTPGADTCSEGEAPWERPKGWDIGTCPSKTW